MKLKELEYGKEIDTLMLDALRESSGEYRTAANSIGISPAAFTRWIVELGLTTASKEIREKNDLAPTPNESLEKPDDLTSLSVDPKFLGPCTHCEIILTELDKSLRLVDLTKTDSGYSLIVRDKSEVRHAFPIDRDGLRVAFQRE